MNPDVRLRLVIFVLYCAFGVAGIATLFAGYTTAGIVLLVLYVVGGFAITLWVKRQRAVAAR